MTDDPRAAEQLANLIGADAIDWLAYGGDIWVLVRDAEDEIERRGLQARYVDALADVVTTTESIVNDLIALHGTSDALIIWRILRATPEQRVRAALRAVEGER